jgi:hypothetical protein
MTTPDEQDRRLDRLLRATKIPPPSEDLAQRIITAATAQPQPRRPEAPSLLRRVFGGLMADWPNGLAYKAAFMLLVALITFGTGIGQGVHGVSTVADDDLTAIIFGDLTISL